MEKPTAISLFSGAGGMDIGFEAAGFKTMIAVELDSSCCKTLRKNLPEHTLVIEGDIRDLSGEELLRKCGLKKGELGVVYGGPPCQSFSLAGKRNGLNDERGMLVGEFIRIVHETLPLAFVMENVKGMVSWQKGKVLHYIEELLSEPIIHENNLYQYRANHKVLDAASFGVAQHRERIFIVGNRMGLPFEFPKPTHGPRSRPAIPFVNVGDAILNLPDAEPPSETAVRVSKTIKDRIDRHGY